MNPDRIARIERPAWARGVKPNHRGFAEGGYLSLAFDTETTHGVPFSLQASAPDGDAMWYLKPREFLPTLLRWLDPRVTAQRAANVVLWGHVLSFDLVALLYPYQRRFAEGTFEIRRGGVEIEVYYGRNPFAKLRFPGGRTVWVLDTFAFVQTSLKKASEIFGLPFEKLPRPRGLGSRVLRGAEFRAYAIRDAHLARLLGEKLVALHEEFDLGLTVSIAHFAGRCFAHNYLGGDGWAALPREVEEAALLSYHGGKNGFYTRPGWQTCREYDISSAYPWAMTRVPSLTAGAWYEVDRFERGYEGFYCVTGETPSDEPYPCLFSHEFQPLRGRFSDTWVTSQEMREALRAREVRVSDIRGYVWVPTKPFDYPLRRFARDFYRLKESADDEARRRMHKLTLNSLYGKFIQLTPMPDGTEKPGAYYRPDVASWITGDVRSRIHRLEHDSKALHTATDAIHSRRAIRTRAGLGGLECAISGPCLFLRNKVYFHFSRDGSEMKYALHGIQAGPRQVWNLLRAGKRRYQHTRLVRPREAVRLKLRPLDASTRWYTIGVGDLKMHPIPRAARTYWARPKGGR